MKQVIKQRSLDELRVELGILQREVARREEAEILPRKRALIGRCFKYRNCYSLPKKPSDYWWLYRMYTKLGRDGVLSTLEVQIDKDGCVQMNVGTHFREPTEGWHPITRREYDRAYRKAMRRAAKLHEEVPV